MNKLIHFQTTNKYLLMAFSQAELNKLAGIIENSKKLPIKDVTGDYELHLRIALKQKPTRIKHVRVLREIYAHFYKKLPVYKQKRIEQLILEYRNEKIKLNDALELLRFLTAGTDDLYVVKQTYFLLFSDKKPFSTG